MLALSRLERLAYYPVAVLGLVFNLMAWNSEFLVPAGPGLRGLSIPLAFELIALAALWFAPWLGLRESKFVLRGALAIVTLFVLARVGLFLFFVLGANFAS
ncbi:MAG TPA: hypothetical protein VFV50_02745 [Bdellovibrionales bacterium]|nr:hypothetical protein [Bdellovibrionales bacterium]